MVSKSITPHHCTGHNDSYKNAENWINCKALYGTPCKVIQIISIFYWLNFLLISDSYYSVYLICGLLGLFSIYKSKPYGYSIRKLTFIGVMSVFFSLSVILANWHLFDGENIQSRGGLSEFFSLLSYLFLFIAGWSISYHSIIFIAQTLLQFRWIPVRRTKKQVVLFAIISMTLFCAIDLLTLFLCNYPGTVTPDAVWQIGQATGINLYHNHHSFYHTKIIELCISIGVYFFHDINAGIAVYSVVQIFAISACFTFALTTLYEIGIPAWIITFFLVFGAILPYNIAYSFMMCHDVFFGGFTLVLIVSVYRIIYKIGNSKFNIVSFIYGGMIVSLFRNNGYIAFLLSAIIFYILFKKKYIKIVILFISVIFFAYVLKNPVLKALDVFSTDLVESLSIPLQQVGRVIADGKEISPEQKDLFGKIINVSVIPSVYKNYISDPIKDQIRIFNNENYLVDHKEDYLKAWFDIGTHYPKEYLKAWIDQTKGFWHGGYNYWIWQMGVHSNNQGIKQVVRSTFAEKVRDEYFAAFMANKALMPLLSIGFHFWVMVFLFCCNIINLRKTEAFLSVPGIAITLTLMIGTPVFSEFRYIYANFISMPFVVLCTLYFSRKRC